MISNRSRPTGSASRSATPSIRRQPAPCALADRSSSIAVRAAFARNHLWVTRYDPAHRYAAGDFVNQHPGGAGLPGLRGQDRDIDGEDIVVWHTFGPRTSRARRTGR